MSDHEIAKNPKKFREIEFKIPTSWFQEEGERTVLFSKTPPPEENVVVDLGNGAAVVEQVTRPPITLEVRHYRIVPPPGSDAPELPLLSPPESNE